MIELLGSLLGSGAGANFGSLLSGLGGASGAASASDATSGISGGMIDKLLKGASAGYDTAFKNSTQSTLLNPAFYGAQTNMAQNNASGSNASLDKSLGDSARKVAGVSEGGSKPQTENFLDYLKREYPNLFNTGRGIMSYLSGGK